MEKPATQKDQIAVEMAGIHDDLNRHGDEAKQWRENHEKEDLEAFEGINKKLDTMSAYHSQYHIQISKSLEEINTTMGYSKWLFDGSKGIALIPKQIWMALLLVVMFTLFGFKAVVAFVINKFI